MNPTESGRVLIVVLFIGLSDFDLLDLYRANPLDDELDWAEAMNGYPPWYERTIMVGGSIEPLKMR